MQTRVTGRNGLLSKIRSNRRGLRARGLTSGDILALEAIAAVSGGGRRLSAAAIGRLVGVSRSTGLWRVRRLEAVGAIIRLRGAILLNVKGMLGWLETACRERLASVKRLFIKNKSKNVSFLATHNRTEIKKPSEMPEFAAKPAQILDWRVGDTRADGAKIVGQRKFGALFVPVWG